MYVAAVMHADLKAVGLQVADPVLAAAAVRVFPDLHFWPGLRHQVRRQGRSASEAGEGLQKKSSVHDVYFGVLLKAVNEGEASRDAQGRALADWRSAQKPRCAHATATQACVK